jgi:hypothetical protein
MSVPATAAADIAAPEPPAVRRPRWPWAVGLVLALVGVGAATLLIDSRDRDVPGELSAATAVSPAARPSGVLSTIGSVGSTDGPSAPSTGDPASATVVDPAAGTLSTEQAVAAIATLRIAGRAPKTGYDRARFGEAWADVDGNGCDTRDDILRRDLSNVVASGTPPCIVESGRLTDPYGGTGIDFQRGPQSSGAVQIDHVVALSDAWQKGAQGWTATLRRQFANDPLNLLAVAGDLNSAKGDGDAATWLPPARGYRCSYVSRQVAVKSRYVLSVTAAERDAMLAVLSSCGGTADSPDVDAVPTTSVATGVPNNPTACEPAYPTICLPPAIGHADLDCGDIAERRFTVLSPDPYRLDGRDNDGLGCES